MKRRTLIKGGLSGLAALCASRTFAQAQLLDFLPTTDKKTFLPNWDSLEQYQVPDWFRDAKFGIWAHWGPQCQPERGDWYARGMYEEGSEQYKYHCDKYGHPSEFGFKDVINEWNAERWDPEYLVGLYKKAGAKYFMALANHHDNLDLYDSEHQKWNSTNVGPKKDLMAGWAKAAKRQGLPLGVSVHAAHAWRWYENAQLSDKKGALTGVPYDGKLTAADGIGKWWQGYDPQKLYAQNHPLSQNSKDDGSIHGQWNWGNGVYPPSKEYCDNFYDRTIDLIDKYNPELVYFDDTALPLWPVDDAGLRIAAHLYNKSVKKHGKANTVIFGKILDEQQRKCMVWDIERGQSNAIEPLPWQTDTCLGQWHYDRRIYDNNDYKSAKTIIHTLVDVISKNGNLMLNVPLRGDGSIDDKELDIVEEIGRWIAINGEGVYGTRPWKVFGEGPAMESAAPLSAQGFNEGKGKPFGSSDIRFVKKGAILYATLLGWPENQKAVIKTLKAGAYGKVAKVSMLGHSNKLDFSQTTDGLNVSLPERPSENIAFVLKLEGSFV
ncbi:alpha-L-fucosidase [Pedobacter antarcticus 4BY]|uniref:alpha-L-fucosidase n=2 Tax=Pedobacter antarcticus TaxID=34086 RepID=A0A081PFU4_9SPHI|nr:alpha-L-fucosidase [Pedobacter antarcticus]KEQ29567.1 alpha-L-fucosidase [Pedobacter antarcticus 4BY]SFF09786.1 alpha-L-fucosidase [Pedobacter antarcticus]